MSIVGLSKLASGGATNSNARLLLSNKFGFLECTLTLVGVTWMIRNETPYATCPLDDPILDWMIRRLRAHVANFPITDQAWISPPEQGDLDPQHNSRTWKYKLWRRAVRSIGNRPLLPSLQGSRDVSVGCDPHTKVVNESVHIRAIQRLGTQVVVDGQTVIYAPTNLICCLPDLRRIYSSDGSQSIAPDTLTVTAMDGQAVHPRSALAPRLLVEISDAIKRLERASPDMSNRIR